MPRTRTPKPIPAHRRPDWDNIPTAERVEAALEELAQGCAATDGNPVFCWAAWATAREAGEPVPAWVADYLDGCARVLLDPANRAKDIPALLAFRGHDLRTFRGYLLRAEAVSEASLAIENGHNAQEAFTMAAVMMKSRHGVDISPRTVKNWMDKPSQISELQGC